MRERRRPAGGADDEQRALYRGLFAARAAGVAEMYDERGGQGAGIRAELARYARGAMLRVLEVTDKVVVLELRSQHEQQVQRCPREPQTTSPRAK
jgi:hypothetical protein